MVACIVSIFSSITPVLSFCVVASIVRESTLVANPFTSVLTFAKEALRVSKPLRTVVESEDAKVLNF